MNPRFACLTVLFLSAVAFLSLQAMPVEAHHAAAPFYFVDQNETIEGRVTEFWFRNPHSRLYLEVTDARGEGSSIWELEFGGARGLANQGWSEDTFQLGELMTASGAPARDGANRLNLRTLVRADTGETLLSPGGRGGGVETADSPYNSNEEALLAVLNQGLEDHDLSVFEEHVAEDYIQHHPGIGQGRQGLLAWLQNFLWPIQARGERTSEAPTRSERTFDNIISSADGSVTMLHSTTRTYDSSGELINVRKVAEIVRFDEKGQMVEHWDVVGDPITENLEFFEQ